MRKLTKLLLCASALVCAVSCMDRQNSSATFTQGVSFELNELSISQYFKDSLLYAPLFSTDQLIYFKAKCDGENSGYASGFKVSALKGTSETPDDIAVFTSAAKTAGIGGSLFYAGFLQASPMEENDVFINLGQYSSAENQLIGFGICNSLYNSRLAEEKMIAPGDYLKLNVELYYDKNLVSTLEKYLVDYRGTELKMINDWEEWDMTTQTNVKLGSFDNMKFRLETNSTNLKPCFCLDNFVANFSVTY